MALFPWDDWFYHVSEKEHELQLLYQQYIDDKASILVHGQSYEKTFRDVQNMMIYNYTLLIIAAESQMTEIDFKEWVKNIHDPSPPQPYDAIVFQAIEGASEVVGVVALGKIIFNVTAPYVKNAFSAVKNWIKGSEQEVANGADLPASELSQPLLDGGSIEMADLGSNVGLDAGADVAANSIADAAPSAGAELGSEAGIAAADGAVAGSSAVAMSTVVSGAAIFIAVGLDAIMGAIQGHKEVEEINRQKHKIQSALDVVDHYLSRLDTTQADLKTKMVQLMKQFRVNLVVLEQTVMPLGMAFDEEPTLQNKAKYLAAMQLAMTKYGYLSTIRHRWLDYKARREADGRPAHWDVFADEIEDFAPESLTDHELEGLLSFAKNKINPS